MAPLANLAVLEERQGDLAAARKDFEETLRRLPTHAIAAARVAIGVSALITPATPTSIDELLVPMAIEASQRTATLGATA